MTPTAPAAGPAPITGRAATIRDLKIIPLAFSDPPLLNASGVHEPLALRTLVKLQVGEVTAWGEGWNDAIPPHAVAAIQDSLVGCSVFDTTQIGRRVDEVLQRVAPELDARSRLAGFSAIEVACLDAQGHLLGLPVAELLGGAVRDRVEFAGYLFYKWAGHLDAESDEWGEALDADGIVRQARMLVDRYGFGSLKLKAGALPPELDIEVIRALAAAFPGHPLRIDPNGAWSHVTTLRVAAEIGPLLEYLEDPVLGIPAMSRVHAETALPLATNMCVVQTEHLAPAFEQRAVQIVLSDHHYWGGLRRTKELAATCEALGMGLSMHSNSHLGISLAAMTQVAASIPQDIFACDTHYPWNRGDDVVEPGVLEIVDGAVAVPTGSGLGVRVDEGKVAQLHERYLAAGRRTRDDGPYMRRRDPSFSDVLPRF